MPPIVRRNGYQAGYRLGKCRPRSGVVQVASCSLSIAPLPSCALHKNRLGPTLETTQRRTTMSNTRHNVSGGFIGRAFAVFGAAVNVSNAVEHHRRPAKRDLTPLGIDPKAFEIGRAH